MHKDKIYQIVRDCLKETFPNAHINWKTLDASEPLTGPVVKLPGRGILYLVYALEERFGIRFTQYDIIEYKLLTIDGICERLGSHLEQQNLT